MKEKVKDLLLGFGLLAVGIIALNTIRSSEQQTSISSAAELTYATMPILYAWLLILLVVIYLAQTILALRKEHQTDQRPVEAREPETHETETASTPKKTIFLRTLGTLLVLLAYVLLLEHVHFLILTILFLSGLFLLYGQRSLVKIVAVSVCGGAVFYLLFIHILKLPV